MAKRKRRKKKNAKWWLPYLAHADQETERGRFLYAAVAELFGDKDCFETLLTARDHCMTLCRNLDPEADNEKWLFYAAVFYGVGQLINERIGFYEEDESDGLV